MYICVTLPLYLGNMVVLGLLVLPWQPVECRGAKTDKNAATWHCNIISRWIPGSDITVSCDALGTALISMFSLPFLLPLLSLAAVGAGARQWEVACQNRQPDNPKLYMLHRYKGLPTTWRNIFVPLAEARYDIYCIIFTSKQWKVSAFTLSLYEGDRFVSPPAVDNAAKHKEFYGRRPAGHFPLLLVLKYFIWCIKTTSKLRI